MAQRPVPAFGGVAAPRQLDIKGACRRYEGENVNPNLVARRPHKSAFEAPPAQQGMEDLGDSYGHSAKSFLWFLWK